MALSRDVAQMKYRAYIDCINAGTMSTGLKDFCHDTVTHNEQTLSLAQYQSLIQEAKEAIPDIIFQIEMLVFDEEVQKLGVILEFTGTPTTAIAGREPNGTKVHFSEHVFYKLVDGKISQVWSLVDWEALKGQLPEYAAQKNCDDESA